VRDKVGSSKGEKSVALFPTNIESVIQQRHSGRRGSALESILSWHESFAELPVRDIRGMSIDPYKQTNERTNLPIDVVRT